MVTKATKLPRESSSLFLTDGGLETTLVFLENFDLPCFAAFHLLNDVKGYEAIRKYYKGYLDIAKKYRSGFILESPTWRANPDWIEKLGYAPSQINEINEKAIRLMKELRTEYAEELDQVLVSGCVGPRGDGYKPEKQMSIEEAEVYHATQVTIFRDAGADLVTAVTMNYTEEAIGITRAAEAAGLPVVISFTVETDGRLVTGISLKEAIDLVDRSVNKKPAYYMINCAHPEHFINELDAATDDHWLQRIKGIRANASCKSHTELDESTQLDRGNPSEFGKEYQRLRSKFPQLNVFGGCCGTDTEHVAAIAFFLNHNPETSGTKTQSITKENQIFNSDNILL